MNNRTNSIEAGYTGNIPAGTMAIFCDCNSRGGVWSYTIRTLNMLRRWGWKTLLISHVARDETQQEILATLMEAADETIFIDETVSDDKQIRFTLKTLLERQVSLYVPNYRKISYAAAALASRRMKISVIGVCHADHVSYYKVLQRYQNMLSLFICASRKTTTELNRYLAPENREKNCYIPHYIEFELAGQARFSRQPFTVIYHGRVREEQKRCSEILRVAERVCKEAPHVRFVLMGDGNEHDYFRSQLRRMNLEERVSLHRSRPWEKVQSALLDSQLGILTSEFEGFCYGAAEAMMAGLPIAAYDCGEVISDFVIDGKTGRLVKWGDADTLAAWIVNVAENNDRWQDYSNAAREQALRMFGRDHITSLYANALFGRQPFTRPWPLIRPAYIPVRGKSIRSLVERLGTRLGAW